MENNLSTLIGSELFLFVEFIGCLLFAFIGSILKEIYNTNAVRGYVFGPHRVISSTIAASLTALLIKSHYFTDEYGWALIAFGSFTLGLLGYEIFKNLCTIEGICHLINKFKQLMGVISGTATVTNITPDNEDTSKREKREEPNISNSEVRIRRGPDDE